MSREKQIEEMTEVFEERCARDCIASCSECMAQTLYNAGYRKQSEEVEEYRERIYNQREELHRLNKRINDLIQSREAWKKKAERVGKQLHEVLSKQIEGEWVLEAKHFYNDYGDLIVYAIAHCSECKTPYKDNHDVDYERIERPEDLDYHADWSIDVEPIKKKLLERAKTRPLHKYCHECGAKMKGGAE